MNAINLKVPAQDLVDVKSLDPNPQSLVNWLGNLHSADVEKSAAQVLDVLRKYNRTQMAPGIRFQAIATLMPHITEYRDTLRDKYRGNAFPLSEKYRLKAEIVSSFMEELAFGFKIVVSDIVGNAKNLTSSEKMLRQSVYFAMKYIAESLLVSYLVYMPEPKGIWSELNRLYKFTEQCKFHTTDLKIDAEGQNTNSSPCHLYKRIVLLSLANPYHLMEGEASKVYKLLNQSAVLCDIVPRDQVKFLAGKFFVDLATDMPPKFAGTLTKHNPEDGRILQVDKMLESMASSSKKLAEGDGSNKQSVMSLKERMNRDMLMRLQRAWGSKLERKSSREQESSRILLTAGLSTSHHFISNEDPFTPERDEIRYYRPEGIKEGLSLMPADHSPWKADEMEEKIDAGVVQHRTSLFDVEAADVDAWEKIYSTKARTRLIMDSKEPDFTAQIWQQRNASDGGMGLVRDEPCGIQVRVGDLVAYKYCDHDLQGWHVATIRWLKDIKAQTLELGIMMLADNARPIAIRAIGGVGTGGEYFRSLVVRKTINGVKTETLIVPANIYDYGTELAFNTKDNIIYVRLTNLIETTNSFSQFEYDEIEIPEQERQNIVTLKGL